MFTVVGETPCHMDVLGSDYPNRLFLRGCKSEPADNCPIMQFDVSVDRFQFSSFHDQLLPCKR